MILSDLGAGLGTGTLFLLLVTNNLELWQIYAVAFISGLFNAFQFPAYSAAVTLMIPKKHYARASGMISLAGSASQILAPVFAAALLALIGLRGIMLIDFLTFLVAIITLWIAHIPQPKFDITPGGILSNLREESLFGFHYISKRRNLLSLQGVFTAINFLATIGLVLTAPYILARTGNNEIALATVQSVGAVGGITGGLLLSTWGGPRRKIYGVLGGMLAISLLGQSLMGIGNFLLIWSIAAFLTYFFLPFINGSNQAIWQSKVPPQFQGRVFSVRRLIAQVTAPIAAAIAGPLADKAFEPAMSHDGIMVATFSWLVGSGPGAGMGVMLLIAGILGAIVAIVAYSVPIIRDVEKIMPDFDVQPYHNPVEENVT